MAPSGRVADRHEQIDLISTLLAEALQKAACMSWLGATCMWCLSCVLLPVPVLVPICIRCIGTICIMITYNVPCSSAGSGCLRFAQTDRKGCGVLALQTLSCSHVDPQHLKPSCSECPDHCLEPVCSSPGRLSTAHTPIFVLTAQAHFQTCLLTGWAGAFVLIAGLMQHDLHLLTPTSADTQEPNLHNRSGHN